MVVEAVAVVDQGLVVGNVPVHVHAHFFAQGEHLPIRRQHAAGMLVEITRADPGVDHAAAGNALLFHDGDIEARLLQVVGRTQAGDAGADHQGRRPDVGPDPGARQKSDAAQCARRLENVPAFHARYCSGQS